MKNLFDDLPANLSEELVEILAEGANFRMEKILSTGQASPEGFWYDQEQAEWIAVLQGEAKLLFLGEEQPVSMKRGDYLLIPAHRKHRVEWTPPGELTVWLALFLSE